MRLGEEYKYLAVDEDLHEDLIPDLAKRVTIHYTMIWVEDSEGYNISHSVYLMILNMMCSIFALSGKSNHYFNLSAIINNTEKKIYKTQRLLINTPKLARNNVLNNRRLKSKTIFF